MSHTHSEKQPVKALTAIELAERKRAGRKITMLTCYDASFAKLISATALDAVLVGDSLGNVILGMKDTLSVTMDQMVYHCRAVSRGLIGKMLVADMPFMSYRVSVDQALENAARLVSEAGAHAVKLEGGCEILSQVRAITEAGIPVIAHLGLTPQSYHSLGGHRVQAKTAAAQEKLHHDAKALEIAGASALVLELIPAPVAASITKNLEIPTIGIGAGNSCDGQVLVLQDMLGFDASFQPKFLKRYAQLGEAITGAIDEYCHDVNMQNFPADEHSYT